MKPAAAPVNTAEDVALLVVPTVDVLVVLVALPLVVGNGAVLVWSVVLFTTDVTTGNVDWTVVSEHFSQGTVLVTTTLVVFVSDTGTGTVTDTGTTVVVSHGVVFTGRGVAVVHTWVVFAGKVVVHVVLSQRLQMPLQESLQSLLSSPNHGLARTTDGSPVARMRRGR